MHKVLSCQKQSRGWDNPCLRFVPFTRALLSQTVDMFSWPLFIRKSCLSWCWLQSLLPGSNEVIIKKTHDKECITCSCLPFFMIHVHPDCSHPLSAAINLRFCGRVSWILQFSTAKTKMGFCSYSPYDLAEMVPFVHISWSAEGRLTLES